MNDEVIGVSVLQPIWLPRIYRFWVCCRRKDGKRSQTWIFVRDREHSDLGQVVPGYDSNRHTLWRFRRHGEQTLFVEPSLNYISFGFHNSTPWSTDYIELRTIEKGDDSMAEDAPRWKRGSAVHYDINWAHQSQDQVDRYLDEIKADGALA